MHNAVSFASMDTYTRTHTNEEHAQEHHRHIVWFSRHGHAHAHAYRGLTHRQSDAYGRLQ